MLVFSHKTFRHNRHHHKLSLETKDPLEGLDELIWRQADQKQVRGSAPIEKLNLPENRTPIFECEQTVSVVTQFLQNFGIDESRFCTLDIMTSNKSLISR